ncbi:EFR1 family ferrodoxin [Plebeiibacterium sediminum]|uniref:EFR1 family ferrodoxin n=1 Tax=Plebeiibacterium sediminum TaxID=2992112 RepID=A0AAE3SEL7_9BACT|nr:EFR1 family ferrodoxin [Plebeiobacterium sediminum]MCW3785253.1 EFR1 family ferrodoxin [Plebeiobacterium sediminum]
MNTALYYFSGTGNSLSVAQSLNTLIKESELYPIIGCLKQKPVQIKAQRVGIIFPIHFMTIPCVVKEFLTEVSFLHPKYVFVIVTGASPKLGNTLSQVEKYLNKINVNLNAAYFVPMIAAHFPYIRISKAKDTNEIYKAAKEKVIEISLNIINQKNEIDKEFSVVGNIKQLISKEAKGNQNHFSVGEGCIRCGYCMQVCPFQNIRLHGKQVQWLDNCHYCFACLHFCSQSVIQYKNLSIGKPRQHHPSILLNDIALQRDI